MKLIVISAIICIILLLISLLIYFVFIDTSSSLSCPNNCSNNGVCDTSSGDCSCNSNTAGSDCSILCNNNCDLTHGKCQSDKTCKCDSGWGLDDCSHKCLGKNDNTKGCSFSICSPHIWKIEQSGYDNTFFKLDDNFSCDNPHLIINVTNDISSNKWLPTQFYLTINDDRSANIYQQASEDLAYTTTDCSGSTIIWKDLLNIDKPQTWTIYN